MIETTPEVYNYSVATTCNTLAILYDVIDNHNGDLPEAEKEYDINTALEALKLICKY